MTLREFEADGARSLDAVTAALTHRRDRAGRTGVLGWGRYTLTREDGTQARGLLIPNRITDTGDEYYAKKGAAGVAPSALAVPQAASGMKLGTGTTAEAKNGVGAALVTYVAASQRPFDAAFPAVATKGAGLGWRISYRCTWAAGVATATGIAEAVIVNEAVLADATTLAAATLSRVLLNPVVNKGAGDSLVIDWFHDFQGQ